MVTRTPAPTPTRLRAGAVFPAIADRSVLRLSTRTQPYAYPAFSGPQRLPPRMRLAWQPARQLENNDRAQRDARGRRPARHRPLFERAQQDGLSAYQLPGLAR